MDRAEIDLNGNGILFFGNARVNGCKKIEGQPNVFLLSTEIVLERETQLEPLPGQFYLLRAQRSKVQLDRPISVYHSELKCRDGEKRTVRVDYMILEKGTGTKELCSLTEGDSVEAIGPLGNTFAGCAGFKEAYGDAGCAVDLPDEWKNKICVIGGGIGVAPVAGFAASLPEKSYDFYASFKSGFYGLEYVKANNLVITTDDGSFGVHGMLSAALDAGKLSECGYKAVFACGPLPMLAYVQKICNEAGVKCFISMENRMACGVGACLGCTVKTSEGNKRVCKDGPVFDSGIILFEKPKASVLKAKVLFGTGTGNGTAENCETGSNVDLSVEIKGVRFQNPVIAASGTFGYGQNYRGIFDVNRLGGICSKGTTLEPKPGNEGVRLVEVSGGLINSIGLENPGVRHFVEYELPEMMKLKAVAIANLSGNSIETYTEGAAILEKSDVPVIELNISCPNVKSGGMTFGMNPDVAYSVVSSVRKATGKPLIVKLTPNAPDLVGVALACIKAGADALSLVNTVQAIAIDIEKGIPVFNNVKAGLCGPAIKPIALRMVYDVCAAIKKLPENERVPVIGIGGIQCWQDAVEFIMAGAAAIQVGTAVFSNPLCMCEIIDGLEAYMIRKGFNSLDDFRGCSLPE